MNEVIYVCNSVNNKNVREGELEILEKHEDQLYFEFGKDSMNTKKRFYNDVETLNKDFDALMKEHNIDPGATEDGYTFTKGEMVPEFEEAAFALSENTYTKEPVKTDYGYHIIYRTPVDEAAISNIIAMYSEYLASAAVNNYVGTIIDNANVTFTEDYHNYINTIK